MGKGSVSNRSIIYIDGFNFYYGAVKGTKWKWLDVEHFFSMLRQDDDIQVIKAFSPGGGTTGSKTLQSGSGIEGYKEVVHTLLFDTPGPGWGGSGQKFDWSLLKGQSVPVPYILSGGIGPEDTEAIGKLKNENLLGIDLNSRFELSPGLKDVGLLNDFFMEIRN